jgi:peptidoglycan/LPS O-acetylase OafA/YrhL
MNDTPSAAQAPVRFDVLDGLRGIAALMVMFYNTTMADPRLFPPGGWAAVDLFFVLSGFVITHAYEQKILAGMTLASFALARLRRLRFVYLAGVSFALVPELILLSAHRSAVDATTLLKQLATALVSIPYLLALPWPLGSLDDHRSIFPIDPPRWSLFFELASNLIFFLYLRVTRKSLGPGVVFLLWIACWFMTFRLRQTDAGSTEDTFTLGLLRVCSEFALGSLILHWHRRVPALNRRWVTAVVAATFLPMTLGGNALACVTAAVMVPVTILVCARVRVDGRLQRLCQELGRISFPLYMTHFTMIILVNMAIEGLGVTGVAPVVFVAPLSIAAAYLLSRCELRLRQ